MSFPIIVLLMLAAGLLGGYLNYLLPANENPDTGKKIKPEYQCIILGIGATILIPLFLEIAQSKLLDNIYYSFTWEKPVDPTAINKRDTIVITNLTDSTKKIVRSDTTKNKSLPTVATIKPAESATPGKSYLLYFAYCLLAAAAGFRFINMLINNVVKDQQISQQKGKILDLEKDKQERVKNSQMNQKQEVEKLVHDLVQPSVTAAHELKAGGPDARISIPVPALLGLPPVIHPDDPQKDRFGGRSENNGRKLCATVKESHYPEYYDITIWVESTNAEKPLTTDVVFYLHDSFTPSVYLLKPADFREGKALDDEILCWGAFTVGAITDNGNTLLELDLSEDKAFPKAFRER